MRWLPALLLVLVLPAAVQARAFPTTGDASLAALQVWGAGMQGYVASGCLHGTAASPTAQVPVCRAFTLALTEPPTFQGFEEAARAVTFTAGDGSYWLLGRANVALAPPGWTCLAGQHYCWVQSTLPPGLPSGTVLLSRSTVAGGQITAVADHRKSNPAPDGQLVATDRLWGAVGDYDVSTGLGTDNTAALQAFLQAACDQNAAALLPPSRAGQGYRITSTLTIQGACPGEKGFQLRMPGQARIYGTALGAGVYALRLTNVQRADVQVQIELITSGNGMLVEQTGEGNSNFNTLSGELIGAGEQATKPTLGTGSMGLRFEQTEPGKGTYWNYVDHMRVRRFDHGFYFEKGANAQRLVQPMLQSYWYGMVFEADETSVVGGWCADAGGLDATTNFTECLHLGNLTTPGVNATARYTHVTGFVMEPGGEFSRPLVLAAGSVANILQFADNTLLGSVINDPLNIIINKGIARLQRQVVLGDGVWNGEKVSIGDALYLWRSTAAADNTSFRFSTAGAPGTETAGFLVPKMLYGVATLDFGATAAHDCDILVMTVPGAAIGDGVVLGLPTLLTTAPNAIYDGSVTAVDTVQVRRCNVLAIALGDPAAAVVQAFVIRQ